MISVDYKIFFSAHAWNGVQGVGGSNPLAPTNDFSRLHAGTFFLVGKCDSFVTYSFFALSGQSI